MAEIFKFEGKARREARKNVDSFIDRCRNELMVFGLDLDWDSWKWNGVVNFTKAGVQSQGVKPEQLLSSDIMDFAKAYIRYCQGHRPTKLKNEIKAIRCIEPALLKIKGVADISQADLLVFDEAAVIARKEYKSSAYQAGNQLERLAKFISDNNMADFHSDWKNPISKPKEINRTGAKTKERRKRLMLSDYQLGLMADLFSMDLKDPRDIFTTSTLALAMCAPGRISEFQDLPVNCLHEETDKDGKSRLGLRFQAGKGFGADIKWVSTPFISIAKEAVKRLILLSQEGRTLAKWIEENPEKFYRHKGCPKVDEDTPLTLKQICAAFGWAVGGWRPRPIILKTFLPNGWLYREYERNKRSITLRVLNNYIHANLLPEGWPWKNRQRDIKFSNALYCMRKHEMNGGYKGVSPVRIWTPDNNAFTFDLGPRNVKSHKSIWERYGYTNPDGSAIKITSHQFRHFLNTLAQEGDLGQLVIAKWSGRVNIGQNRAYNHVPAYKILDKVKKIDGYDKLSGPLEKVKKKEPVTLEDLNAIGESVAHITEFGFCVHDFSMVPCQKHRDCLNCTEQVCIKGDKEKLKRLIVQQKYIEEEYEKAAKGIENGFNGADRWYEHQKLSLARINELIELLESKNIPDGAVIQLRNDLEHSPLKREIAARTSQKEIPQRGPNLSQMKALMGGGFG